jgi:nucleotide-binding universal stress UspA family protein
MSNLFIVPHDFTSVGDAALQYALFLAKPKSTTIELLHIVSDKSKGKEAYAKLQSIIEKLDLPSPDIQVNPLVKVGSIFDDIGKIAEEKDAGFIIMGTHGAKGMQKVFGSYAIKVVTSTSVPFLVVQESIRQNKIDKIVVPLDESKESLQIINHAASIARLFDAEVHIVAEKQRDPRLLQQVKIRISLVNKEYQEKGVKSEVHYLDGSKSYTKKIMNFAKSIDADMIALAYYSSSLFSFDSHAQVLMTNDENLPCLIVNSKLLSKLYY